MSRQLALAALMLIAGGPLSAAADPARYMRAELIAETLDPPSGSTTLVGFKMTPQSGWHGYWSNPGDSGIAPTVSWTAPRGVTFGPLLHPSPSLLTANGVSSFVHDGPHVLLSRMTVSRSISTETPIPIVADLSWAACTATQCVPLHAKLHLQLTAGTGQLSPEAPVLRAAVDKLPSAAADGTFVRTRSAVRLQFPASLKLDPRAARFFPEKAGAFDTAAAHASREAGRLLISAAAPAEKAAVLSGIVTDGRSSYRLSLREAHEQPAIGAAELPKPPAQRESVKRMRAAEPPHRPAAAMPAESGSRRTSWIWLVVAAAAAVGAVLVGVARRRR
jgi:DsbC/DsbD-like thiol-disulfide interchange protein